MSDASILVAGIGNTFLGDDAFGVEVVRRLARETVPDGVEVRDFGVRGFDLATALVSDYRKVVLVDAVRRSGRPGTLYRIAIDPAATGDAGAPTDAHRLEPHQAIALARRLGEIRAEIRLIGCEPATCDPAAEGDLLSPRVEASVGEAVAMIRDELGPAGEGRRRGA